MAIVGPVAGKAIGIYYPVRGELDTAPLARALSAEGAMLGLPVVAESWGPMLFRSWAPEDPLATGFARIPVPMAQAPRIEPDVLIVPLAAFDRRGHRIGYGAGYYDRTLSAMRSVRPVLAVGLAFACQEVDQVPDESHDELLNAIVTERGPIRSGSTMR